MDIKLVAMLLFAVFAHMQSASANEQKYKQANQICVMLLKELNNMYKNNPAKRDKIRSAILYTQNLKQQFKINRRMKMSPIKSDISKITNHEAQILQQATAILPKKTVISEMNTQELIDEISKDYNLKT